MSAPITIRDRRHLPFFMVHLDALEAIRGHIGGPPRSRALGLYVLLCQIANEQRATGERRQLASTYPELTRRGALSTTTLKKLLTALDAAGAATFEIRVDRTRGSMPSLIRLPITEGPWTALSVPMAERLCNAPGAQPLPTLGLLITLLEFCEQQRDEHGGQRAEVTRGDIARRLGLSADRVDDRIKTLEATHVLHVTRRRAVRGPALPSLYDVIEPDQLAAGVGGATDTPPGQIWSRDPAEEEHPGRRTEGPGRHFDPATAAEQEHHGGNTATPTSEPPPVNAPARHVKELPTKKTTLITPSELQEQGRGESSTISPGQLCEALLEVLDETRGPGPRRRYAAEQATWHTAASRLLDDHPVDKLTTAIDYLAADQIIGTKIRGMIDLERHIEDLRHRAHAANLTSTRPASSNGMSWPTARGHLERAIHRHGADAKSLALADLTAVEPLLGTFVEQVGWRRLCQTSMPQQETSYRVAWLALTRTADQERSAA